MTKQVIATRGSAAAKHRRPSREAHNFKKVNPKNHVHHILPIHAGGTNDPSNLIEVSTAEHAYLHQLLWIKNGDYRDYIAWRLLASTIGREEAFKEFNKAYAKIKKGYVWYHNPKDKSQKTQVLTSQTPPEGWVKGRGKASARWYHNPLNYEEKKVIYPTKTIPKGWLPGRGKCNSPTYKDGKNPTKGKIYLYNPDTKEIKRINKTDTIPEGFISGTGKQRIKGVFHIHNPDTKERKVLFPNDTMPEGFIFGGGNLAPNKGKIRIYNPDTKESYFIFPNDTIPRGWKLGMVKKEK